MKSCLKNIPFLFAVVFAFGAFQVEDASAQGPIIRRMRETFNKGRPLLPFVSDSELKKAEAPSKKPTPASKPQSRKTPTPATKAPTPAKQLEKFPNIKLESSKSERSDRASQTVRSEGFGMVIEKAGESFVVSQVNPRGNAASAGVKRGDVVTGIGGAKLSAIEEFEGIADAMTGGDRVEFEVSRRGSKTQKFTVQFGQLEESNEDDQAAKFDVAPSATKRSFSDRYVPAGDSGLESVYDGAQKPSSIMTPTPAPPRNSIESLEELDFPALEGGK
jgi:hypothetical protein